MLSEGHSGRFVLFYPRTIRIRHAREFVFSVAIEYQTFG